MKKMIAAVLAGLALITGLSACDPSAADRANENLSKAAENFVTFVSTQLEAVDVDFFRPRIIFRPESIVPNFDLSTGGNPSE